MEAAPCEYMDARAASRALFGLLKVPAPGLVGGPWAYLAEAPPLLLGAMARFWTEHSERNWPPSLAAAAQ
eukprot:10913553-Lingulodinium_polyedra.AAC.1